LPQLSATETLTRRVLLPPPAQRFYRRSTRDPPPRQYFYSRRNVFAAKPTTDLISHF
jgi:hypothetical protein